MKSARAALLLCLLVSVRAAPAGFRTPIPLGELISAADAIVVGTVRTVKTKCFSFEVQEVLHGGPGQGRLSIEKLQPDAENPRWTSYRSGQKLLLFLRRDSSDTSLGTPRRLDRWRIAGFIGEGEIPLDAVYAYFPGRYLAFLAPAYYEVHGAKTYLQRMERATVIDAIRGYRRCFSWDKQGASGAHRSRIICEEADLEVYRSRSPLHDFLVREAKEAAGS